MVSSGLVRRIAVVVCAGGIAGMIVSSVLNHNGAAITFGLVTAAAVLCSMVATAVAADVTRQFSAKSALPTPAAGAGGGAGTATPEPVATADQQAALVEALVDGLLQSGTDETDVRELVRESVRLGRVLAAR